MTVLAAIYCPTRGTYIGADGRVTDDGWICTDRDRKWFLAPDRSVAISVGGYSRAGFLVANTKDFFTGLDPNPEWKSLHWLRRLLDDDGWQLKNEDEPGSPPTAGIEGIIATKSGVWEFGDDLCPIPIPPLMLAVGGSGGPLARGAALALAAMGGRQPRKVIEVAIKAAIASRSDCGGEIYIDRL